MINSSQFNGIYRCQVFKFVSLKNDGIRKYGSEIRFEFSKFLAIEFVKVKVIELFIVAITDLNRFMGIRDVTIHEMQEQNLKLPIILTYSSSSIQPDRAVDWVGLSWNLSAGGSITRKANSIIDEYSSGRGYMTAKTWGNGSNLRDQTVFNGVTNVFSENEGVFKYVNRNLDDEPDEFTLSVSDLKVKFYIDRDGKIISNGKIKFEFQTVYVPTFSGGDIVSWILTFEDGTKYYFEQIERTTTNINFDSRPGSKFLYQNTAWHLTKVESADGKNKIQLKYQLTSNSWTIVSRNETYTHPFINPLGINNNAEYHFWIYQSAFRPAILQSIETSDQIVTFIADESGINTSQVVLRRIEVKQKNLLGNMQKIKSYNFNIIRYGLDKMLLKELKQEDATGNKTFPPYLFTYDERVMQNTFEASMQNNSIGAIDHWGYGIQFAPGWMGFKDSKLPKEVKTQMGMDRTPSETYASIGLLTYVTYP